jgi:hypothetical protein
MKPHDSTRLALSDAAKTAEACARESVQRLEGNTARDCADLYAEFKAAVEELSHGSNTVLLDDAGMPSVMVRVESMRLTALLRGASDTVHPAFQLSGGEAEFIYVSKYQNIIRNERAYSLPMCDPQTFVGYEEALAVSARKGPGWGLMPFSLWAAVALWARNNGTMPRGNNDAGHDWHHPEETGVPTAGGRVATGSGPCTWSHNGQADGIYDLNGNMNEWAAGLRSADGEIQLIPGADCMLPGADHSEDSPQWRAILPSGALVPPGTPGTLRYAGRDGGIHLTASAQVESCVANCAFQDITADEGLPIPDLIRAMMLFPEAGTASYGGAWRWVNTGGERLPLCGGAHRAVDHAGIFFAGISYPRTHKYELSGFRCACLPERSK